MRRDLDNKKRAQCPALAFVRPHDGLYAAQLFVPAVRIVRTGSARAGVSGVPAERGDVHSPHTNWPWAHNGSVVCIIAGAVIFVSNQCPANRRQASGPATTLRFWGLESIH